MPRKNLNNRVKAAPQPSRGEIILQELHDEIHRLYGVSIEITCSHCAMSLITEEGYISDNEVGRLRDKRLRTPLSFESKLNLAKNWKR